MKTAPHVPQRIRNALHSCGTSRSFRAKTAVLAQPPAASITVIKTRINNRRIARPPSGYPGAATLITLPFQLRAALAGLEEAGQGLLGHQHTPPRPPTHDPPPLPVRGQRKSQRRPQIHRASLALY
jgi:hypothetical protein